MGLLIKYAQHINKDIIEKTGEKKSVGRKLDRKLKEYVCEWICKCMHTFVIINI